MKTNIEDAGSVMCVQNMKNKNKKVSTAPY